MFNRLRIMTKKDRDHIAYDILSVFRRLNIGIVWMETYTKELYIKFREMDADLWVELLKGLWEIEDIDTIEEVDLIAFETRNLELNEIINLMSEIVFVIDCNGVIKYTNVDEMFKHLEDKISPLSGTSFFELVDDKQLKAMLNRNEDKFLTEIKVKSDQFLVRGYKTNFNDSNLSGHILLFEDLTQISEYEDMKRYRSNITFNDLIYESEEMAKVVKKSMAYSQTESNILITAESGTGKELFTRAIHNLSKRRDKPFIAINCSSLPEQLLESELFGYESGSFTGALKGGKAGIFESCNGGTIFLDEIGDMPYHLQPRLLRVLQEKKIRRIGGNSEIPVDFQVISATNQDLYEKVEKGEFRMDLFFRINTLSLTIPPLRNRREDIIKLAEHFADVHSERNHKKKIVFSKEALEKLYSYDWPGNVRELQNIVERAVALSTGKTIVADEIILRENHASIPELNSAGLDSTLESIEKDMILKELSKSISIRKGAKNLGITHTRLLNRIKKYDLKFKEE